MPGRLNHAIPRERLVSWDLANGASPLGLLRQSLSSRRAQCAWAWLQGGRLQGVAAARTRSSLRVWEVTDLYIPSHEERGAAELLERLSASVAQRGAEWVFLRLVEGSPLVEGARRSGFFPLFAETLFWGEGRPLESPAPVWEPRQPTDEFAIFQLYNAVTPASMRPALGLTLDAWKEAQERRVAGSREWVHWRDDKVKAWLHLICRRGGSQGELLVHSGDGEALPVLLDGALRLSGWRSRWLVPEYEPALGPLLLQRGFQEVGRYAFLAKSIAVRVEEPGLAPVEA
ncbi:MAG: hypothetical protein ACE5IG_03605 [Dehalococcoidia bacterium]